MGNMHSSSLLSMHYKDAEGLVEKSKQCIICLSSSNLITKITSVFNMRDRCCAVRFDETLVGLSCEVWACAASLNPGKGFCCYACEQTLKRSTQKKPIGVPEHNRFNLSPLTWPSGSPSKSEIVFNQSAKKKVMGRWKLSGSSYIDKTMSFGKKVKILASLLYTNDYKQHWNLVCDGIWIIKQFTMWTIIHFK